MQDHKYSAAMSLWVKVRNPTANLTLPVHHRKRTSGDLFDHLVGAGKPAGGDRKSDCLRGRVIDYDANEPSPSINSRVVS